jgi:hypothetical protein
MATTSNITSSLMTTTAGSQSWDAVYSSSPQNPLLASYDFETLRKALINYIQLNNPESYTDYINSSEFISLVDCISYLGQSLSYRIDLNARECFLSTATTRNAITALANLVNYKPSRNLAANGYLKITSLNVNEDVYDSLGNNLNGVAILWNDKTNRNWLDQWNCIINAILINSQTVGSPANTKEINDISTSEYNINLSTSSTPPYAFTATVDSTSMTFEMVNTSSVGKSYLYELSPKASSNFNLLYQNDGNGYASTNTGFFFYFKQGTLSNETFTIDTATPNYTYTITATGVNDNDVWLYQVNTDGSYTEWTQVDSIYSVESNSGTIFSVSTITDDGITLVFGDGVFGDIPNGNFIVYTRSSNGLSYRINPSEMTNMSTKIAYTSKTSRTQSITLKSSLQYTVGNSSATESLGNIKLKAPQSFYSQNRMVNGQDYTSFPFTKYSNILQSKAINRVSSGISAYLDVADPTGKYSSTISYCDDGFMYLDSSMQTNTYTYTSTNALATVLEKALNTIVSSSNLMGFIFNNYSSYDISGSDVEWNLSLRNNTSCSGYLTIDSSVITINDTSFAQGYGSVLVPGAIIKFTPPSGYMFDANNDLVSNSTGVAILNQSDALYATISATPTSDGYGNSIDMTGVNIDGTGAITLNQIIPSGALLTTIFPYYTTTMPSTIISSIVKYAVSGVSVAVRYYPAKIGNSSTAIWDIITSPTFPLAYSPDVYGSSFVQPSSSSSTVENNWVIAIVPQSSSSIIVYNRSNAYYFGSAKQNSFYFDSSAKVYDPINAYLLPDKVEILKVNAAPSSSTNLGLSQNIPVDIFDKVTNSDGTSDNTRVKIQYADFYSTGVPSNPVFFSSFVESTDYVFLVTNNTTYKTTLLTDGLVVSTPSTINSNLYNYSNGTIIYCTSNDTFYKVTRSGTTASKSTLNNSGDTLSYSYYNGRQDISFEYIHHAADSRRIDPSPANVIDLYVLESSYATAYQQWLTDTTGSVSEPDPPTTTELSTDYSELEDYKMITDEIIMNSAQFVPLFGSKAANNLQATFVAVLNSSYPVGSGEIASNIITLVNEYFMVGNFAFGQTFYWSQLSNYIMTNIGNLINSIHLVPTSSELAYGNLEEITCNSYEIFVSCATVSDVSVVSSLTNLNLRIS